MANLRRPLAAHSQSTEAIVDALSLAVHVSAPARPVFSVGLWDELDKHTEAKGQLADIQNTIRANSGFARIYVGIFGKTSSGQEVQWVGIEVDRRAALLTVVVNDPVGDRDARRDLAMAYAELFPSPDYTKPQTPGDDLDRLMAQAAAAVEDLREKVEDAEKLRQAQRASVQDTAIKHHAAVFSDEAGQHNSLADEWLKRAKWSIVALSAVAIALFAWPVGGEGAVVVGQLLARLTLLSIPATALGVSVRQYSVARHNWVVARHRSNALASYEAFALAIDKSAKDALLAQALGLIFSPQATGYSKAAAATDSLAPMVELMKGISAGKS